LSIRNIQESKMRILVLLLLTLLVSCEPSKLEKEKFIQWCNSKLTITKEFNQFKIDARVLPEEYYVALENRQRNTSSTKNIHATVKFYQNAGEEGLLGKSNSKEFQERLNYFIESAKGDFLLIHDKDTFPPVLYHFERYYNIANYSIVNLVFEVPRKIKYNSTVLVYDDQQFNLGKVTFSFDKFNSDIPQLIEN